MKQRVLPFPCSPYIYNRTHEHVRAKKNLLVPARKRSAVETLLDIYYVSFHRHSVVVARQTLGVGECGIEDEGQEAMFLGRQLLFENARLFGLEESYNKDTRFRRLLKLTFEADSVTMEDIDFNKE